eukprot:752899-Prymnesium_polylepis.1
MRVPIWQVFTEIVHILGARLIIYVCARSCCGLATDLAAMPKQAGTRRAAHTLASNVLDTPRSQTNQHLHLA